MAIVDTTMVLLVDVFWPYVMSSDGWTLWEPVCDGQCVRPPVETQETEPVAQPPPTIACEDEPRDEALRMNRRPHMTASSVSLQHLVRL
jgi:hypothetical protein